MGLLTGKCLRSKLNRRRDQRQKFFSRRQMSRRITPCVLLTIFLPPLASAQNAGPDISELSLDTLSNTEITSVARKAEKLSQAAAAIFVITQEDIRRSGLTSIPELLRIVPGMSVAQMDANQWAVTARGFNERFADKTLVLIDGRTVYTPLSSGVYWDVQDTMLEDIERIEVIRGPGATLWGANAVNGVINIITKKAADTQGTLVEGMAGSKEGGNAAVRYGGPLRGHGFYRIFTKYTGQSAFADAQGNDAADDWQLLHGGFRSDWNLSKRDDLTVQGDIYKGNEGQTVSGLLSLSPPVSGNFNDRTNVSGGDLLGRWTRTSSERFDTSVQAYFEIADRSQLGVLGEFRHTIDIELLQHFAQGPHHDFVWGADYRLASDHTFGSLNISFNPASRSTNLYGAFFQDEITLVPDKLHVTVGAKLEHNYYSGFAVQPNIRALWTVHPHYTIWAAISRAAENSSRFDADIRTNNDAFVDPNGVLTLQSSFGTHHLPSENVVAFELGQRGQVSSWLAFDVDAFYNRYSNRHTHEPAAPFFEDDPAPTHLVLPSVTLSRISGETHGLEVDARLRPASFWNLIFGYTLFEIHLHAAPISQDFETAAESEGSTPRHAFLVRSQLNLPHKLEFDAAAYYVGELVGPQIPSYTRVDARFGWHASESVELSAGVQDLLTPRHFEFGTGDLLVSTQVGRNAYGKVTWRF
jgi:iron complex outermembrane receptor protein